MKKIGISSRKDYVKSRIMHGHAPHNLLKMAQDKAFSKKSKESEGSEDSEDSEE